MVFPFYGIGASGELVGGRENLGWELGIESSGRRGNLFLNVGQLLLVVGEEGSGEDGHAGPGCRVPSLLVLLGQFNPGLDVDLEVGGGVVVSGVFG